MKIFFLVVTILLFHTNSYSQKNEFELSLGHSRIGTGDIKGLNTNIAYKRLVYKSLGLFFQINHTSGFKRRVLDPTDFDGYPFAQYYATANVLKLNLGPSLKMKFFKSHSFNFEPALSLVSFKFLSSGGFIRNTNLNVPKELLFLSLPINFEKGYAIGGMGQIGYRYHFKNNIKLGPNINIQLYQKHGEINSNIVMSKSF
jgi:hypothetical protein